MKDKIVETIYKIINSPELGTRTLLGKDEIQVEVPEIAEHGDYSTNIALQAFTIVKSKKWPDGSFVGTRKYPSTISGKSAREFADNIKNLLDKDKNFKRFFDKIEVAGPGFINFWLSRTVLVSNLEEVLKKGEGYGKSDLLKSKRIMFEFGQPNTHKLPHIGHLFSYIYGGSMTNILESAGSTVQRANYQGDIGPHVAKCLWAYENDKPSVPETLDAKVKLLQEMYQKGSQAYDMDENSKEQILEVNKKIYKKEKFWYDLWKKTREWNLEYYKNFERRLGISFDRYYFESEVEEMGKKIVEDNVGKIFERSEGALIFKGSKYGLHDRVFITKYGTPTYEAKDMYLQSLKIQEWPMDILIITTAHEQNEYFKVIFSALQKLGITDGVELKHIGFGMVNLKTGKMSSRTGEIISAIDLVDKVVDRVSQLNDNKKIAEVVGLGAVKYSFLKNNPLQDTKFDIDESIASEGNSGPYLQYTYARTQSVLAKSQIPNPKSQKNLSIEIGNLDLNDEEIKLLRSFVHFPEVIESAAKTYSPNLLCNYLYDLAQKFNVFYNKHRIIGSDDLVLELRLGLTIATGQILKTGLNLLGIQAPQKM